MYIFRLDAPPISLKVSYKSTFGYARPVMSDSDANKRKGITYIT